MDQRMTLFAPHGQEPERLAGEFASASAQYPNLTQINLYLYELRVGGSICGIDVRGNSSENLHYPNYRPDLTVDGRTVTVPLTEPGAWSRAFGLDFVCRQLTVLCGRKAPKFCGNVADLEQAAKVYTHDQLSDQRVRANVVSSLAGLKELEQSVLALEAEAAVAREKLKDCERVFQDNLGYVGPLYAQRKALLKEFEEWDGPDGLIRLSMTRSAERLSNRSLETDRRIGGLRQMLAGGEIQAGEYADQFLQLTEGAKFDRNLAAALDPKFKVSG